MPATRITLRNRTLCEYHAGVEDGAAMQLRENVMLLRALDGGMMGDVVDNIASMLENGVTVHDLWGLRAREVKP